VLDHLDNLESDFSAIHHRRMNIERGEFDGLTAGQFFRLAERIPAYAGVMQALILSEEQKKRDRVGGSKIVDLTPEMAASGGVQMQGLQGLIQFG
jgi:hypothetical protein